MGEFTRRLELMKESGDRATLTDLWELKIMKGREKQKVDVEVDAIATAIIVVQNNILREEKRLADAEF